MKSFLLKSSLADNCWRTLNQVTEWKKFNRNNSLMYEYYDWEQHADIREAYNVLHSQRVVKQIEEESGIEGLLIDPMGVGEGISKMIKGCKLDSHVDFNWNDRCKLNRAISITIYLGECEGGEFQVWDDSRENILWERKPLHNTSVMFYNSEQKSHAVNEVTSGTRYAIRKFYYTSNGTPKDPPHQSLYWYDGEKAYNPQKKMTTNSEL